MKKHNQKQQLEAEKKELAELRELNKKAVSRAINRIFRSDDVEFSDDPEITREPNNPEKGCWVAAWVWIPDIDEK